MKFAVVSLMPEMFDAIRNFGVTSRAFERNLVTLTVVNPRTFAEDRHGTVDDRPYGGGPGMVLKAEPMLAAVKAAKAAVGGRPIVVHFSPRGKPLDQGLLASWIEHFDEMVFQTIIQRNVRLSEAPSYGESIISYDAGSKGANNYLSLANELIAKNA